MPTRELEKIDRYLHTAPRVMCDVSECRPFLVYMNRETDSAFLSYARPAEPLPEDPDALLERIVAAKLELHRRGRVARWEWIHDLYPALAPALEAVGLVVEETPLMTVTRETFHPDSAEGVTLQRLGPDDDPAPMIRAQRRSFGMDDEDPSPSERAVVRAWLERGGCFYAAHLGSEVVGGGACLAIEGVAEVAGIGTVPEHRRRGVAGSITSALIRDCLAAGCDTIFLTAGNEPAVRAYQRVGFRTTARGMAASEPA
jgi:ribosomal protein S18 acetylase RimI-like enzyme